MPINSCVRYLYVDELFPDLVIDFDNYYECEQKVLSPALREAGYELRGQWYTGDGDSFGPLSRCIETDKGSVVYS